MAVPWLCDETRFIYSMRTYATITLTMNDNHRHIAIAIGIGIAQAMPGYSQSLLIISLTCCHAATWPLVLELIFFLSNNVHMSKATEMFLRYQNSNNCTHSGNVCYCMYNDYDKFRSFSRLYNYDYISASNLHIIIICIVEPTDF